MIRIIIDKPLIDQVADVFVDSAKYTSAKEMTFEQYLEKERKKMTENIEMLRQR